MNNDFEDSFYVKWTGELYIPYQEKFKIKVESLGIASLNIDGSSKEIDITTDNGGLKDGTWQSG